MKLCQVDNCFNQVWGKGYCINHQYLRTDKKEQKTAYQKAVEKKQKSQVHTKVRSLINTDQNKLVANQAAEDISKLEAFFDLVAKDIEAHPYCMECSAFIPKKYYRSASAHVLPKRKEYGFPSVATHLDNYLILGNGCGCHNRYDKSWEDAASMKIWPLAVEKFLIIYPAIDKSEYKNIPEVLRQEIPV